MAKVKEQGVNKLFAIWTYDSPPYWLGAPVIEVLEDGYVTTEKYNGIKFKYWKLYPLKEGEAIMKRLQELAAEYKAIERKAADTLACEIEKTLSIPKGEIWNRRKP